MKTAYPPEPVEKRAYTARNDRSYTRFASLYDKAVRWLPVWKRWLRQALPHIRGPRVLEVSFGTGYLLCHYAEQVDAYGIDYNAGMVRVARANLREASVRAALQRGDVAALPYPDATFDTVVNTMAFSGYPDGQRALAEMRRVLRPGGTLVLIDFGYPADCNRAGTALTRFWVAVGDIIRDLDALFDSFGFVYSRREIGGFGSAQLYLATKPVVGTEQPDASAAPR